MEYVSGVSGKVDPKKRALTATDVADAAANANSKKPKPTKEEPDDNIDVYEPPDDTQYLAQLICTASSLKAKAEEAQKVAEAPAAAAEKVNITTLDGQIADFRKAQEKAENELSAVRAKLANAEKEKAEALIVTHSAATLIEEAEKAWTDYQGAKESVHHHHSGLHTAAVEKVNCLKNNWRRSQRCSMWPRPVSSPWGL